MHPGCANKQKSSSRSPAATSHDEHMHGIAADCNARRLTLLVLIPPLPRPIEFKPAGVLLQGLVTTASLLSGEAVKQLRMDAGTRALLRCHAGWADGWMDGVEAAIPISSALAVGRFGRVLNIKAQSIDNGGESHLRSGYRATGFSVSSGSEDPGPEAGDAGDGTVEAEAAGAAGRLESET
jgi:hypothetical protein